MKSAKNAALLFAVLGLAAVSSTGAARSDAEDVRQVVVGVIDALKAGDFEKMGQHYAPEATQVAANYSPPVEGWAAIEERHLEAHAGLTSIAIEPENIRVIVRKDLAWAMYQWRFAGELNKQILTSRGHTTLILEKRKGKWLVVHNHSSLIPTGQRAATERGTAPK